MSCVLANIAHLTAKLTAGGLCSKTEHQTLVELELLVDIAILQGHREILKKVINPVLGELVLEHQNKAIDELVEKHSFGDYDSPVEADFSGPVS